jgi:hypothetical protein
MKTTSGIMKSLRAGALALVVASGTTACMPAATAPTRRLDEWHRIVVIPKLDSETISSATRKPSGERGERAVTETTDHKLQTLTGTWMARYRWEPYTTVNNQPARRLATIEIIFCPFDQADFTRCRVGVAWSSQEHPMGDQRFRDVE